MVHVGNFRAWVPLIKRDDIVLKTEVIVPNLTTRDRMDATTCEGITKIEIGIQDHMLQKFNIFRRLQSECSPKLIKLSRTLDTLLQKSSAEFVKFLQVCSGFNVLPSWIERREKKIEINTLGKTSSVQFNHGRRQGEPENEASRPILLCHLADRINFFDNINKWRYFNIDFARYFIVFDVLYPLCK